MRAAGIERGFTLSAAALFQGGRAGGHQKRPEKPGVRPLPHPPRHARSVMPFSKGVQPKYSSRSRPFLFLEPADSAPVNTKSSVITSNF